MTDEHRYEYECQRCGVVTIHGPGGGKLGCGYVAPSDGGLRSGASDPCPATSDDVTITAVAPDGSRKDMGTFASLVGSVA